MNGVTSPTTVDSAPRRADWPKRIVTGMAIWLALTSTAALVLNWKEPRHRAIIVMAWGLIALWVGGCGLAMRRWRDTWNRLAAAIPCPWMIKFVLGCVSLALLEEAITTAMTNAAPLLGVRQGQAYITASANYLDVALYHSVVIFAPFFIAWAIMLRRWAFQPFAVFVLFGITGMLCETIAFGPQNLAMFAQWIFVYGLMVWLPAHWAPIDRNAHRPSWWTYPVAVFLPFLFLPLVAIIAPWLWLTPKHPNIHFAPIGG
jgi:hypothetical protein